MENLSSVLEFGCGSGRVLRHWHGVQGPRIFGTDYSERLAAWCRANLPFASVSTNGARPPLPYEAGLFDLVYSISVFTHLSEELQVLWMKELSRVVRPGGRLLITTHGANCRERLTAGERQAFDSGRLVVRHQEASGMNLCAVYHPEAYVRERLSRGFTVEDFIPGSHERGLQQDLYLLRKRLERR